MNKLPLIALAALVATPSLAEENRQLHAHEHGVGQLDIAFDGTQIAMELHAPGADIVGFEYAATSAQDHAAVEAAVALLASPLDLFAIPEGAACQVVEVTAELESEEEHHSDEEGEEHAEDAHDHEDAHTDENHVDAAGHTEFHAEYLLTCGDPAAITEITFPYFQTFPNALELEVQVISDRGATAFEVERDAPKMDLRNVF